MTIEQQRALALASARMRAAESQQPETTQPSTMDEIKQGAGNVLAGAVRGAGSIGATILYPWDKGQDLYYGDRKPNLTGVITGKQPLSRNEERRAAMDEGLRTMGAQPESMMYGAGKLGGEIAGTAGVGGAIAGGGKVAGKILPGISSIPALAKYAPAIQSGGFNLGNAATKSVLANTALRAGSGAVVGGTAAGLVDPESAKTGALIGGALPGVVKVAGYLGSGAKNLAAKSIQGTLGMTTGAGQESIKQSYQAGKLGSGSFLDNMRGNVQMTDVLDDAKTALSKMRLARAAEYKTGMAGVSADKTILDFAPIENAVLNLKSLGSYKGQVINKNASGTIDDIANQVESWAKLNPQEFHTPEGLDALKQAIGDIRDSTQFGTPARRAADNVYHAVKKQITDQAPDYAKTMKSYSEASDLLSEIQRSLVGGEKTSADTAMRKLQSLMRNNVNTNYGNRINLAKELEKQGGKELLPAIAGQALNSTTPRGLQALAATGTGALGMINPSALLALPLTSPRLMGEAVYGAGRMVGSSGDAMRKVFSNPAIANNIGLLNRPDIYKPFMTVAPSIAYSR